MRKKALVITAAVIIAVSVPAALLAKISWPNHQSACNDSSIKGNPTVCIIGAKPKCSQVNKEGRVCGGELKLSMTAYKETTDKKCPFCNGTGKNCSNKEFCNQGKLMEWRSAYVCQKCNAFYDVDEINKQMGY